MLSSWKSEASMFKLQFDPQEIPYWADQYVIGSIKKGEFESETRIIEEIAPGFKRAGIIPGKNLRISAAGRLSAPGRKSKATLQIQLKNAPVWPSRLRMKDCALAC